MLETFTLATFEPHVGEPFSIHHGEGVEPLAATLVSVESLGSATDGREPFSIVFRGPAAVVLGQGIHRIDHTALGSFELFIVPIGPDGVGMGYEAIFS